MDPYVDLFPELSPYNYVKNNPIHTIDRQGKNPFFIVAVVLLILVDGYDELNSGEDAELERRENPDENDEDEEDNNGSDEMVSSTVIEGVTEAAEKIIPGKKDDIILEGVAAATKFLIKPSKRVLQTGGHTLKKQTLKVLELTKQQGKKAIEGLKKDLGLPRNFHSTKIMDNGDVVHSQTGDVLGNLYDYVD